MTIYAKWVESDNRFEFTDIQREDDNQIEITDQYHSELTTKNSLGYHITKDLNGYPIALHPDSNLSNVKRQKKNEINLKREEALNSGFLYNGIKYDCSDKSKTNINGYVSLISSKVSLPSNFVWRSFDNENIPFTSSELLKLASAMSNHINDLYTYSWELKDLIESINDVDAIKAINWNI